ncbi:MAG: alanine racemase [Ruminococcus sp.]
MDILRRTWAEIDLAAAEHNFKEIRKHIGNSKLCCVVKADAYGHGAQKLAALYSSLGADFFAVSNIDEAEELRNYGIEEPILVLGYTPAVQVGNLARYGVTQAVYGLDYAKTLSESAQKAGVSIDIHIKIDTGMSRIGFMCQSFPEDDSSIDEIEETCKLPCLNAKGIMAHFAQSDEGEAGAEYTKSQLKSFNTAVDKLRKRGVCFDIVHHANSGGVEFYPEAHFNMVRAGVILYGLEPNPALESPLQLKPVMSLKSSVAFVKNLRKGSAVSYGGTFTAPRDMRVATVPIGYADGYFRCISKDGYMSIKGKKAKILGRICMDQTVIDVTDIEDVAIGDEVTVFSNGSDKAPTANDLALFAGTINYEIICAVSKRVPRFYLKNNEIVDVMYKL